MRCLPEEEHMVRWTALTALILWSAGLSHALLLFCCCFISPSQGGREGWTTQLPSAVRWWDIWLSHISSLTTPAHVSRLLEAVFTSKPTTGVTSLIYCHSLPPRLWCYPFVLILRPQIDARRFTTCTFPSCTHTLMPAIMVKTVQLYVAACWVSTFCSVACVPVPSGLLPTHLPSDSVL